MMKKLMILCFWLLLLLPNVLFPFVKDSEDSGSEEKRELAAFPVFSPEEPEAFPRAVESYINDHAAFRNRFLSLNAALNLELFGYADSMDVIKGRDGWYFFAGGRCVQDALGIDRFTPQELEVITGELQRAADYYRSRGIEFIAVFPPNKEDIYREYLPPCYRQVTEASRAMELTAYVRAHSDVTVIDPREYFKTNRDYMWYYKTDTHWNYAAGFAVGQMIVEALGGTAVPIEDVQVDYTEGSPGDLANLFHMPKRYCDDQVALITGYYDDVTTGVEDVNGDGTIVRTSTPDAPDPRRVAFFRDSFGLAIMDKLPRYFRNMDFYHWQVFQPSMLEENPPDVLVYEILEREQGRITFDMDTLAPKGLAAN